MEPVLLIKTEFIKNNNITFDESLSWGEDMLFFSEVALKAKAFSACKKFLTQYNMYNSDSLTESFCYLSKIENDLKWLNKLENLIGTIVDDLSMADSFYKLVFGYRRPGSVIYNLLHASEKLNKIELKSEINKNKNYINDIAMVNGLRSLKMFIIKYYIIAKSM